jgi:hypothetical protein
MGVAVGAGLGGGPRVGLNAASGVGVGLGVGVGRGEGTVRTIGPAETTKSTGVPGGTRALAPGFCSTTVPAALSSCRSSRVPARRPLSRSDRRHSSSPLPIRFGTGTLAIGAADHRSRGILRGRLEDLPDDETRAGKHLAGRLKRPSDDTGHDHLVFAAGDDDVDCCSPSDRGAGFWRLVEDETFRPVRRSEFDPPGPQMYRLENSRELLLPMPDQGRDRGEAARLEQLDAGSKRPLLQRERRGLCRGRPLSGGSSPDQQQEEAGTRGEAAFHPAGRATTASGCRTCSPAR